jgi:hypothetical protein
VFSPNSIDSDMNGAICISQKLTKYYEGLPKRNAQLDEKKGSAPFQVPILFHNNEEYYLIVMVFTSGFIGSILGIFNVSTPFLN